MWRLWRPILYTDSLLAWNLLHRSDKWSTNSWFSWLLGSHSTELFWGKILSCLVCYQAYWIATQMYINFSQLVIHCLLSPIFCCCIDTHNIYKSMWTNYELTNNCFWNKQFDWKGINTLKGNLTKLVVHIIYSYLFRCNKNGRIKQKKEVRYQGLRTKR